MLIASTHSTTRTAILPNHMSSLNFTPCFSEVHVARSLIFCVVFCRSLFVFLSFFCWSLYCLSFCWSLYCLSFCWSLYCLSFFYLQLLITALVSFDYCIVCPSSIYGFWLQLWYLQIFLKCIYSWHLSTVYIRFFSLATI